METDGVIDGGATKGDISLLFFLMIFQMLVFNAA